MALIPNLTFHPDNSDCRGVFLPKNIPRLFLFLLERCALPKNGKIFGKFWTAQENFTIQIRQLSPHGKLQRMRNQALSCHFIRLILFRYTVFHIPNNWTTDMGKMRANLVGFSVLDFNF